MILYIIATIICWALWAVFNKVALHYISPFLIQTITSITFCCLIPIYLILLSKSGNSKLSYIGIGYAVIAAICTSVASICYMIAASKGEVSTVLSTVSTYPMLAFLISVMFLGETFTISKVAGICTIIVGVWILNR